MSSVDTNIQLLEALPVAIYMTDAEGRITYFNQAAADLWGHRPELGEDRWCGSWRLYWPDGRPLPHDECPMAIALKEGRAVRGVEAILERPDGRRVRFCPYPTPLRDASGRITGAINLLMDVTDRHQAGLESALLAAIVTSSDDAIVSKTLDGRVTSWNSGAERIFGYRADEMIGQPITRIIPLELHDQETEILAKIRRGERIQHYETERVAKDGRRVDISLSVSPVCDESGQVIGASKVGRDISERKRAEKLQRLLTEELNHRVRNTLATVQAIASQSQRVARSPGDFVLSFNGRVQALARAHDLLIRNAFQSAEVMDLVREQVLLGGADDKRISCSGPLLMLDAQTAMHLALVMHELGTNARKYGALSVAKGRLTVSWAMRSRNGREFLLHWSESGGPRVTVPSGSGFGTSLIEHTVQAHGGEAFIQYGAEGVSCEIRLPLAGEAPQALPASEETRAAAPRAEVRHSLREMDIDQCSLRGNRILVVEDEPLVSMDIEASLSAAGCEVVGPASKLDQAMALAERDCDAALVDANLAGHPVDELVAMLKRRNIPFAFVTGYGRESLPRECRDAAMLAKPFGCEQLLAVVAQLLQGGARVIPLRQKRV
jgi:PAS domain S-box-containing protein